MLHKYFNQDKFDKQISKAFDYMSKFNMNEEEMFKRQYKNLTTETYNLKKKANELETKLFTLKN